MGYQASVRPSRQQTGMSLQLGFRPARCTRFKLAVRLTARPQFPRIRTFTLVWISCLGHLHQTCDVRRELPVVRHPVQLQCYVRREGGFVSTSLSCAIDDFCILHGFGNIESVVFHIHARGYKLISNIFE